MKISNPFAEKKAIEFVQDLFIINIDCENKRFEFLRKQIGMGYIVPFTRCKELKDAMLLVNYYEEIIKNSYI